MAKSNLEEWLTEANLLRITQWFREGLSDEKVAKKCMGISRATFYRRMKQSKKFKAAVDEGKKPVIAIVENALIKSSTGYDVMEGRINANGEKIMVKKHIPPNITAIIFYLKNRDPKRWRNKWDFEIENSVIPVIKNDIRE